MRFLKRQALMGDEAVARTVAVAEKLGGPETLQDTVMMIPVPDDLVQDGQRLDHGAARQGGRGAWA